MRPRLSPLTHHPVIAFGDDRPRSWRHRIVLGGPAVTYHRATASRSETPTPSALRAPTSQFRFPVVGRLGQIAARRVRLQLGTPRVRRG